MAKFDESKVINCLHTDKAEIGKEYYFSDSLYGLKEHIEDEDAYYTGMLTGNIDDGLPFQIDNDHYWQLIYPYEEPPKKRMTNRQLMEWLTKGNGFYCVGEDIYNTFYCLKEDLNNEVNEGIEIRSWDSDEWVEPTVNIYERDCKGEIK